MFLHPLESIHIFIHHLNSIHLSLHLLESMHLLSFELYEDKHKLFSPLRGYSAFAILLIHLHHRFPSTTRGPRFAPQNHPSVESLPSTTMSRRSSPSTFRRRFLPSTFRRRSLPTFRRRSHPSTFRRRSLHHPFWCLYWSSHAVCNQIA